MRGSNAMIGSCRGAAAAPDGTAARGLDEEDAPAFAGEGLGARRPNPASAAEPAAECDCAVPCGVFDVPAPDASRVLFSERRGAEERMRFLILSMIFSG